MSLPHVLIADTSEPDDALIIPSLSAVLEHLDSEKVHTWAALEDAIASRRWDAVLISRDLPGFNLIEVIRLLEDISPRMVVILVSGGLSEGGAVAAMRAGAADCVLTSELERLAPALELGLRKAERARRSVFELSPRRQAEAGPFGPRRN